MEVSEPEKDWIYTEIYTRSLIILNKAKQLSSTSSHGGARVGDRPLFSGVSATSLHLTLFDVNRPNSSNSLYDKISESTDVQFIYKSSKDTQSLSRSMESEKL